MKKSAFGKQHIGTVMLTRHTKLNLLFAAILAAAMAPGLLLAQVAFKIPLRIVDAATGNATLWFGVHPQASNCIDTTVFGGCDSAFEFEAPPISPSGVFDTRFVSGPSTACLGQGEYTNIQKFSNTAQIDSYYVYVQPGGAPAAFPITLSWPSDLSTLCDSAFLVDEVTGGAIVNANMVTKSSVSFKNKSVNQLDIFLYGPKHSNASVDVPALTSPANDTSGVDTSLTFTWQPVTGAVGYTIQVSTDSHFGSFVLNDTTSGTSKQLSGLSQRKTYYWRVKASSVYLSSCFQSPAFLFTTTISPPGIPVLIVPAANDTTVIPTPTFRWHAAANADSYRVQIAKDQNFTSVVDDAIIADTSTQFGSFQNCTSLYWRVFGKNPSGLSASSEVRNFKIVSAVPGTPRLVTPHAGDTVQISSLLHWSPADPCSNTFHLQVATDSNFSAPSLAIDVTQADTTAGIRALQNCVSYFWRVNAGGSKGTSPYTAFGRFTVAPGVPSAPQLGLPKDKDTVATTPTLHWASSDPCTKSFRLQVASDSNFTVVALDTTVTDTTFQVRPLQNCASYYWHVAAKNPAAGSGPYAKAKKFVVTPAIPSPPVLHLPTDGDTTVTILPTLTWAGDPCSKQFHLQVATDTNFTVSSIVLDTVTGITSYRFTTRLQTKTWYYWQVSSAGVLGAGAFSRRSFETVKIGPPTVPVLISPADGATGVSPTPTFSWHAVYQADTYRLQVARDTQFTSVVFDDSTLTDTSKQIPAISSCSQYYWRVQSKNTVGISAFSSRRAFHTQVLTPATPSPISPPPNGTGVPVQPTFEWSSSFCVSTYELQVARDAQFNVLVYDDSLITDTSRQIPAIRSCTQYFWRVRAKNYVGVSAWSPTQTFQTVVLQTSAPFLSDPRNDSTYAPIQPTLAWTGPFCAATYELQVSPDSNFSRLKFDDSTIQIASWDVPNLNGRTRYYWRVRAGNSAGWSPWSATWHFTTTLVGVANWVIPLSIRETAGAGDTLYFGVNPAATYGIDPGLGEFQLPPPAVGQFDIRFVDIASRPGLLGEGVRVDLLPFHTYAQVDSYHVKFQLGFGAYPVMLSWPQSFVQQICDSMLLVDEFGGVVVKNRMDLDSSAAVSNVNISTLYIIKWGAKPLIMGGVLPVASQIPKGYQLYQNYPNPFNPSTRIEFSVERAAQVRITVYDVLGREIRMLTNGLYEAGKHAITWDGRSESGAPMTSGVYYIRMIVTGGSGSQGAAEVVSTRKMILLK
jgi:hypothetical protein